MTAKRLKIRIVSVTDNLDNSGLAEGEPERDELTAEGRLERAGALTRLSYAEKRDGSHVDCEILVKAGSVRVTRRGSVKCDMVFEKGRTHASLYEVPPYSFDMEITALRISDSLDENGGTLELFYEMKLGGARRRTKMTLSAECI